MKLTPRIGTALLLACMLTPSAHAMGRRNMHHPASMDEIAQWMKPVAAADQSLSGPTACRSISISARAGGDDAMYDIEVGGVPYGAVNAYEWDRILLNGKLFHEKWADRSGVIMPHVVEGTEVELVKDASGKLTYLSVKDLVSGAKIRCGKK